MTVHPIHGVGSPALPAGSPAQAGAAGGVAVHRPHDLVDVSPAAALLRRLDAVLRESPARFEAVTARTGERLRAQVPAAEPQQAAALARLAERFQSASLAGSAAPLVADHGGPHLPQVATPGQGTPNPAALAALAAAAAAAPGKPGRPVSRSAYRARVERAGGEARDGEAPAGGLLGSLLAAVAGVVEAALDAALAETTPAGASGEPPSPAKGR